MIRAGVRIVLPAHLRNLSKTGDEVTLEVTGPVTIQALLDALEQQYPMLQGTIRDHDTLKRRPFVRFFACSEDVSHEPHNFVLPEAVVSGTEPFLIIGAISGG